MHLCQTGQTENEERIVNPSRRLTVLVRGKERQQTCGKANGYKAALQRGEEEAGHTREYDKRRGDGVAVHADEGIEVIKQDHQVTGQGVTAQLNPPIMLDHTAYYPDGQTIENRHR